MRLALNLCLKLQSEDEELAISMCEFQSEDPLTLMENWLKVVRLKEG